MGLLDGVGSMKHTIEEVAKLLSNRINQPHYVKAKISRCVDDAIYYVAQERDQLAARVEELIECLGNFDLYEHDNIRYQKSPFHAELNGVLRRAPAASLLLHDAGVLEGIVRDKALDDYRTDFDLGWQSAMQSVHDAAAELRKQAAGENRDES